MSDNETPFHIAANPKDTVLTVARRYRAAFGDQARCRAVQDAHTAARLGLPIRQRLCRYVALRLKSEDKQGVR